MAKRPTTKNMLDAATFVAMVAGLMFLGASFNDSMTDRDTLWRVIGIVLLVAGLVVSTWVNRHDPITRNPLAVGGAVLCIGAAILTMAFDSLTVSLIAVGVALVGLVALFKASKAEEAAKAASAEAASVAS